MGGRLEDRRKHRVSPAGSRAVSARGRIVRPRRAAAPSALRRTAWVDRVVPWGARQRQGRRSGLTSRVRRELPSGPGRRLTEGAAAECSWRAPTTVCHRRRLLPRPGTPRLGVLRLRMGLGRSCIAAQVTGECAGPRLPHQYSQACSPPLIWPSTSHARTGRRASAAPGAAWDHAWDPVLVQPPWAKGPPGAPGGCKLG